MQDTTQLIWPQSADSLCQTLHVACGAGIKCHGTTKKSEPCTRDISGASGKSIAKLLDRVVAAGSWDAARKLLEELSQLVLCKKDHQKQGHELLSVWQEAFADAERRHGVSGAAKTKPETPIKRESTLPSPTPKPIIKSEKLVKPETASELDLWSIPPIASSPIPAEPPKQAHVFVPYGKQRTLEQINKAIKGKLGNPLSANEIKCLRKDGVVYVYTFGEDLHTARLPHLKIGYTNNLERRTQEWSRQCGYGVGSMCNFPTIHYIRVERLVHAQLWQLRRREEDCPGCHRSHKEFFNVRLPEASKLIAMWADWLRLRPYNEDDGSLKEEWMTKLKDVDLKDPNCWDKFTASE